MSQSKRELKEEFDGKLEDNSKELKENFKSKLEGGLSAVRKELEEAVELQSKLEEKLNSSWNLQLSGLEGNLQNQLDLHDKQLKKQAESLEMDRDNLIQMMDEKISVASEANRRFTAESVREEHERLLALERNLQEFKEAQAQMRARELEEEREEILAIVDSKIEEAMRAKDSVMKDFDSKLEDQAKSASKKLLEERDRILEKMDEKIQEVINLRVSLVQVQLEEEKRARDQQMKEEREVILASMEEKLKESIQSQKEEMKEEREKESERMEEKIQNAFELKLSAVQNQIESERTLRLEELEAERNKIFESMQLKLQESAESSKSEMTQSFEKKLSSFKEENNSQSQAKSEEEREKLLNLVDEKVQQMIQLNLTIYSEGDEAKWKKKSEELNFELGQILATMDLKISEASSTNKPPSEEEIFQMIDKRIQEAVDRLGLSNFNEENEKLLIVIGEKLDRFAEEKLTEGMNNESSKLLQLVEEKLSQASLSQAESLISLESKFETFKALQSESSISSKNMDQILDTMDEKMEKKLLIAQNEAEAYRKNRTEEMNQELGQILASMDVKIQEIVDKKDAEKVELESKLEEAKIKPQERIENLEVKLEKMAHTISSEMEEERKAIHSFMSSKIEQVVKEKDEIFNALETKLKEFRGNELRRSTSFGGMDEKAALLELVEDKIAKAIHQRLTMSQFQDQERIASLESKLDILASPRGRSPSISTERIQIIEELTPEGNHILSVVDKKIRDAVTSKAEIVSALASKLDAFNKELAGERARIESLMEKKVRDALEAKDRPLLALLETKLDEWKLMRDEKEGLNSQRLQDKEEMLKLFDVKLQENAEAFKLEMMKELEGVKGNSLNTDSKESQEKLLALADSVEAFKGELNAIESRLKQDLGSQLDKRAEQEQTWKKDFRFALENRLSQIRKEVEIILHSIIGKEDEEDNLVEEFARKVNDTMEATEQLQTLTSSV
eukprot:TRINITY_DN4330_c0_g1_i1.p1 TRINITY_DN4330_c0_g1~~TRINITY_DN4330_c0_g1_i1.p1  ORF type:complete len:967 (+),score=470.04 TRINITY_DN4330_c0_g1_i1:69-2969(+)